MNETSYPAQAPAQAQPERTSGAIGIGGSMAEALGGIASVALAIIALVGVIPKELTAIATIVLGAAFFCEGGTIAAAYRQLLSRWGVARQGSFSGGMTVEFMAGVAGIVLGILALFLNFGATLLGAASIVFGAAMLLSSQALSRVSWLSASYKAEPQVQEFARESATASAGGQILVGLAAIVLGILAVAGLNSMILIEVSVLCLGVGVLLVGTVFGSGLASAK